MKVFVYGTLMRGESNHRLLSRAAFLSEGRTRPEFRMLSLGSFPAIVTGGTTAIAGEVFEVDEATVEQLDRLEGHPHFYRRTELLLEDGVCVVAYVLAKGRRADHPEIPSGSWHLRGEAGA